MLTGYRMRAVVSAILFGVAMTAVADDEPSEKVIHKSYDVRRLIDRNGSDKLIDLISKVIAPTSWDTVGGPGGIAENKKGQLDVLQTAAIHKNLAKFLQALGKLPALQPAKTKRAKAPKQDQPDPDSKDAEQPTAKVSQIPVGTDATADQIVVIYHWNASAGKKKAADWNSLVDKITSTIAPNTWDHVGGPGAIAFYPKGQAIVVLQSKDVHKQIAEMLEKP